MTGDQISGGGPGDRQSSSADPQVRYLERRLDALVVSLAASEQSATQIREQVSALQGELDQLPGGNSDPQARYLSRRRDALLVNLAAADQSSEQISEQVASLQGELDALRSGAGSTAPPQTREPAPESAPPDEPVLQEDAPAPPPDDPFLLEDVSAPPTDEPVLLDDAPAPSTDEPVLLDDAPAPSTDEPVLLEDAPAPLVDEPVLIEDATPADEPPTPDTAAAADTPPASMAPAPAVEDDFLDWGDDSPPPDALPVAPLGPEDVLADPSAAEEPITLEPATAHDAEPSAAEVAPPEAEPPTAADSSEERRPSAARPLGSSFSARTGTTRAPLPPPSFTRDRGGLASRGGRTASEPPEYLAVAPEPSAPAEPEVPDYLQAEEPAPLAAETGHLASPVEDQAQPEPAVPEPAVSEHELPAAVEPEPVLHDFLAEHEPVLETAADPAPLVHDFLADPEPAPLVHDYLAEPEEPVSAPVEPLAAADASAAGAGGQTIEEESSFAGAPRAFEGAPRPFEGAPRPFEGRRPFEGVGPQAGFGRSAFGTGPVSFGGAETTESPATPVEAQTIEAAMVAPAAPVAAPPFVEAPAPPPAPEPDFAARREAEAAEAAGAVLSAAAHPARAPLPSTPPADPEGFRDWVLMAEFAVYPVPAPVIQEEDEDDYEFDYSSLDEPGASEPPGHIAAAATHPPAAEVHVQSPPPIVDPGYVTPVGPTADVEDRVEAYEPPAHEQTPFQQPAYEQPAYEQPAYEPAPTFEAAAQHPDTEGPGGYAPEPGYGDVLEHETVGDVQQTDVEEALVAQLTDPVSALDPDPSIVGDTYGEDSSQWVEGSPNGGGQPEAGDAGEYAYGEEGYDEPTEPSGEDEPAPVFVEDVFFGRKAKRGR